MEEKKDILLNKNISSGCGPWDSCCYTYLFLLYFHLLLGEIYTQGWDLAEWN